MGRLTMKRERRRFLCFWLGPKHNLQFHKSAWLWPVLLYRGSCRQPGNRALANVIAEGKLGKGRPLRPASAGLRPLRVGEFRGSAHIMPALLRPAAALGGAGADQVALHVREAAENGYHQPPGAGAGPRGRARTWLPAGTSCRQIRFPRCATAPGPWAGIIPRIQSLRGGIWAAGGTGEVRDRCAEWSGGRRAIESPVTIALTTANAPSSTTPAISNLIPSGMLPW